MTVMKKLLPALLVYHTKHMIRYGKGCCCTRYAQCVVNDGNDDEKIIDNQMCLNTGVHIYAKVGHKH